VIRDISDRMKAEHALARAKNAADAASSEFESFSYSVAHDLRAPLRGIDGYSQVLLNEYSSDLAPEAQRCLLRVRDAVRHMAQLIESLLSLAHISQSEILHEQVDLSAIARAAALQLQSSAPERSVELHIADGLACRGDRRLLTMVLTNLLGNAWKFTGKLTRPRIEFGRSRDSDPHAFFVSDNGAGFDMTFAAKLFGVFQRLHARHEFEGTGIGLAAAQRIIQRHRGRIWAEGAVDRGATFFFTLGNEEVSHE
jgi:light-regulated signal transduction histidine kinase (bacteriophytochrome)